MSESEEKTVKESDKKIEIPKKKLYTDFTTNTVFVGNLPITYDKTKVTKLFSRFGKVVSARIRCIPIASINMKKKVAAIKKEFNPRRNSVVAYVKFASEDSVKAAVDANGMIVDGHHLRINLAETSTEIDTNKAIFVGGLPFDIEDDELWEFFENCGKINSVRIIRDSHTSMGKGIGYVNFDSTAAVELALQMDGQELKKRCINVKRCLSTKLKKKTKLFGKKKTEEMVEKLLSKRNQTKIKTNKKNKMKISKLESSANSFTGSKANVKKKKQKKPSQQVMRKKKIVKILEKS
ncbi:RNA-binding protein, putative [Pediculus humanus corporis]|uniref:RNA-binding protein, putative n=1 Tax=Pediculus humanus subsp. corporis TaxID=121224 RepID=E0W081_PEDHC|nr:RNA-binding protein, putative [Pediculus humanus corporis]EEB19037.1 RNA-binding protein, putative [Pediculus humanus corporis]